LPRRPAERHDAALAKKKRSAALGASSAGSRVTTRRAVFERPLWLSLALVALNLFVYASVRHFQLVNWDDPTYLTENPNIGAGLTWHSVTWALTTGYPPYWHPMTWLSYLLEIRLFGVDAGVFHVTNLLLHIANTLLVFVVFRRMTGAAGRSAFVAALFAVHPLHVESVAWIAERKDVLSTLFWMLTIWTYVVYVSRPRWPRYLAVLALFGLALMSKPMVVTLPVVLLLLDVWPLGRLGAGRPDQPPPRLWRSDDQPSPRLRRSAVALAEAEASAKADGQRYGPRVTWTRAIVEKLPLLALALATSVATVIVQKRVGAVAGLSVLSWQFRAANAIVGYVAYLWKTIWPTHLAAFYPFRAFAPGIVLAAGLVLVALTAAAFRCRRDHPYLLVGWLWYIVTVTPVIGFIQAGEQRMADRFVYVPMIGLLIAVAWGTAEGVRAQGSRLRRALPVAATLVVLTCAVTARAQVEHWSDSVTLWQHAIRVTPDSYIAFENLGQALRERGQLDEAKANYTRALALSPAGSPGYAAVIHNSLGMVLTREGKTGEAAEQFAAAVRFNPGFAEAQSNLGNALAAGNRFGEAIEHYGAAVRSRPDFTEAQVGLGSALVRQGHAADAIPHYREALRIDPNLAQAHNGLGAAFALEGHDDEAMAQYGEALRLKPDLPTAHLNIAVLSIKRGNVGDARRHLETALSIDPGYEPARRALAAIASRR
jgi:tetratricopeptide (TPR) repeat protein